VGHARCVHAVAAVLALAAAGSSGCGGSRAVVPISYAIDQARDLPPGLETIAVLDAEMDSPEDQKWSELAANRVQAQFSELNSRYGHRLRLVDRKHAKLLADERDLVAAGVAENPAGAPPPGMMATQLGVDAFVVIRINVSEEVIEGRARTISGIHLGSITEQFGGPSSRRPARGARGRRPPPHTFERRSTSGAIQTQEVPTVTRTIAVRPTFLLIDAVTGRTWDTYAPPAIIRTDEGDVSPLFGRGKTEADLRPRDRVIDEAIEIYASEFLRRFFPHDVGYRAEVRASENELCRQGVRLLKARAYPEAVSVLQSATEQFPDDDRAHFALGIAHAATGEVDAAIDWISQAIALSPDPYYVKARTRLSADRDYIHDPASGAHGLRDAERDSDDD